jgi:hypothetical protein
LKKLNFSNLKEKESSMKKNLKILIKSFFLFSCLSVFFGSYLFSSIDFANRSSCIALDHSGSKVVYSSAAFPGWHMESLVKSSGGENLKDEDANNDGAVSYNELVTTGVPVLTSHGITGPVRIFNRLLLSSPVSLPITSYVDINFASDSRFVNSGIIDMHGHAIILGGDITLPDNFDIKFTTSAIIDGQGHTWIFGHNSKIRFDNYITVTFRNITLRKVRNHSDGNASISIMGPWRSKLVFENAEICLADNFSLTQGQMFIHNDVKVSGTTQFNYTTTQVSFITKNSKWMFDLNTSFSYGPAELGWAPTGDEGRRLIRMVDRTSELFLNGMTLYSTLTGLYLDTGTLIFRHKNYLRNRDSNIWPYYMATSISQAITFGTDLRIEIMPGASFEIGQGIMDFVQ